MRARNASFSFRLEKETLHEHPPGFRAFFWIRRSWFVSWIIYRHCCNTASHVVSPRFPSITLIARVPRIARSVGTRIDLTIDKRIEKTSRNETWCLKRVFWEFFLSNSFFFSFNLINDVVRRFFSFFFFFFLNHPVYKHIMKRELVFQMCIQACCSLTYRFTHQHSSAYLASSVS